MAVEAEVRRHVEVGAGFSCLTVKRGRVVMSFELGPDDEYAIPMLAGLTGQVVDLDVRSRQQTLALGEGDDA